MMSINLALIIVLSVMVAVLWCNKRNENFIDSRFVPDMFDPIVMIDVDTLSRGRNNTERHNNHLRILQEREKHKLSFNEGFSGI
jgi:hypothetical protein